MHPYIIICLYHASVYTHKPPCVSITTPETNNSYATHSFPETENTSQNYTWNQMRHTGPNPSQCTPLANNTKLENPFLNE